MLENIQIYIMSENDPRAFAEYTTHATSFQLRIPVQIVSHPLYKWIVETNNKRQPLIHVKKYAELTIQFAENNPEYFSEIEGQKMLLELKTLITEIKDNEPQKDNVVNNIVPMDNYKKPTFLQMQNTKLSNNLFNWSTTKESIKFNIKVGKEKNSKKPINIEGKIYLSIFEDNEGVKIPQNINAYDRAVHDGVCTVIANNLANNLPLAVTPNQIYEAMTGKKPTNKSTLKPLMESLYKLNHTRIEIDYTQQAKEKNIDCEKTYLKGNILDFREIDIIFNKKQKFKGILFLAVPILQEYGTNMEQLISVDSKLLSGSKLENTDENIVIRHYLLRRIALMKNKKNRINNHCILYDTLFEECKISGSKQVLSKKRKNILKLLEEWKQMKYIYDYEQYKKNGNKISGVEIFLSSKKKKLTEES